MDPLTSFPQKVRGVNPPVSSHFLVIPGLYYGQNKLSERPVFSSVAILSNSKV